VAGQRRLETARLAAAGMLAGQNQRPPGSITSMNIIVPPFLADGGEGYLSAMAQVELMKAYAAAVVALCLAFLPWGRHGTRWLRLGFALTSACLVLDSYRGNQPLPSNPVVLFFPLAMSLAGLFLSWRLSGGRQPW
jgi:hypothetical protein